ncbi:MAG: hypothetical protein IT196_20950 [Acidimicrobiales bacterium]|nr:hypothetical protein [Acidimicrobiales bacterium]
MAKGATVDVQLTAEESDAVQKALRTYCSDLRMEIVDTDNAGYKRDLKHERAVLESALAKLDGAAGASEQRDEHGRVVIRVVSLWSS